MAEGRARGGRVFTGDRGRRADQSVHVARVHAKRLLKRLHRILRVVLVEKKISPLGVDVRIVWCQFVGVAEVVVGVIERLGILEGRQGAGRARQAEAVLNSGEGELAVIARLASTIGELEDDRREAGLRLLRELADTLGT